ncbi:FecR family protein [Tahibacter aquaticus]|uniref:FecR family protein n=1 Tax=Tahibacter aquaticus TaxID=520092 RepID=A0A4R6Z4C7_9GAMM|nr:DUF6600 domain-containing protein [Tahibacter aquaticus]TDR46535.1 FecR family protein [Tahibacter aquaticus]
MSMLMRFAAILGGALLAVVAASAHAEYVDPPSRVARLSFTRGEVSFSPAGEDSWVNATRNRPLIRGDRLWADRGARAELQAGNATFRIDEGTSFQILNLDDRTAQVEVTQGTLNLRVRRLYEGQIFEVDTPTLAFVVSRPGEYRIDVDSRGRHTTVAVWDGDGEAHGERANFRIREGEAIRFYDTRLQDYETFDIPRPDDFDRFCAEREDRFERSVSRQYVSEDLIGYSDLDEYGSWSAVSDYGNVWFPSRVSSSWAPYRDGHWIWQDPWGWTWVDDADWGFAPFHYGRWVNVRNRWGWIPGPRGGRSVYAPALVAFVGGSGFNISISSGRPIGWFPLGPRDVFVPSYRTSRNYFTSINVSNTVINNTYITNVYNDYSSNRNMRALNYHNRAVAGAITAVSSDTFVNSRSVRQQMVAVNRDAAARAEVSQVAAFAPNMRSVVGSGRAATSAPQREIFDRAVVARTAPPAPVASFNQREAVLQRTPGRGMGMEGMESVQRTPRPGAQTAAPERVRVVGAGDAGNVRTADSAPGRRGTDRNAGPEGGLRGETAPDRGGALREGRGATPAQGNPLREGGGVSPSERAPVRQAPADAGRGGSLTPPERDFTRPTGRTSPERVETPRGRVEREAETAPNRDMPQRQEQPAQRFERREAPTQPVQREETPRFERREAPPQPVQRQETPRFERREAPPQPVQREETPRFERREAPPQPVQRQETPRFERREAPPQPVQRQEAPRVERREAPPPVQQEAPRVERREAPPPQDKRGDDNSDDRGRRSSDDGGNNGRRRRDE